MILALALPTLTKYTPQVRKEEKKTNACLQIGVGNSKQGKLKDQQIEDSFKIAKEYKQFKYIRPMPDLAATVGKKIRQVQVSNRTKKQESHQPPINGFSLMGLLDKFTSVQQIFIMQAAAKISEAWQLSKRQLQGYHSMSLSKTYSYVVFKFVYFSASLSPQAYVSLLFFQS